MTKEIDYINPKLLDGFFKYMANTETKLPDQPNGEVEAAWDLRPEAVKALYDEVDLDDDNREFIDSLFEEDLEEESMPLRITKLSSEITDDDEWEWELEDVTRDINKLRVEIDMLVGLLAEKNDAWQDKEHYRQMIYREQLKKEQI